MSDFVVSNVSDTAHWVAMYRAAEFARPDALFRDAFAERLAGARGRAIAEGVPRLLKRNHWPMVMRTKAADDLVSECIAEGADRVLNLAAGLDARPYRMALPSTLTWVEADLPGILDEKERVLARETPRCRLVRERVDLSNPAAREAFLDKALDGASRAVVLTEGLLIYLSEADVADLVTALARRPAITDFITDLVSPRILTMLRREMAQRFAPGVEMRFGPADGVTFFRALGWRPRTVRPLLREAARTNRLPWLLRPLALLPDADPARPGHQPWSAVVRFERH